MTIVSTQWLEDNFDKVKIIDCSWHLPNTKRNPDSEFDDEHIENAIFFDLDKNSENHTDLPHMMPNKSKWENILSSMGISNKDEIVIYDNSDLFSSCRCWFSFIYFGHNHNLVHVLDGGLQKWKLENRKISNKKNKIKKTNYKASQKDVLIKTKKQIDEIITEKWNRCYSKTTLAEKVSEVMGVNCNRKLVAKVLEGKRSSQEHKLLKKKEKED